MHQMVENVKEGKAIKFFPCGLDYDISLVSLHTSEVRLWSCIVGLTNGKKLIDDLYKPSAQV